MYAYIYIYMCVCVCARACGCVCEHLSLSLSLSPSQLGMCNPPTAHLQRCKISATRLPVSRKWWLVMFRTASWWLSSPWPGTQSGHGTCNTSVWPLLGLTVEARSNQSFGSCTYIIARLYSSNCSHDKQVLGLISLKGASKQLLRANCAEIAILETI